MDKMAKNASSYNFLNHRRLCPCQAAECYIDDEWYEDEELTEHAGLIDARFPTENSCGTKKIATTPFIGQSFESDEEALEFYINFARNSGFLVRRERSKGNPDHPLGVYKRELVCHRAGPPLPMKSEEVKRQRKKKPSRCKCDAQMVIKKNFIDGVMRWVVVNFSNVHNHEMLGSDEVQSCPGFRYISAADKERILALAKGGCNANLILKALEMEKGVESGELTFTEKDVKNFLQSSVSINPETEAIELLKTFKSPKEKNPDLRYELSSDEANMLEHVVWSYVGSSRAYKAFGDVVFFDTTYHLNSYGRTVGVWYGVDNNGHTIFFGCVILQDEKPESYRWAIKAFLRLMDGKSPQTIVTDLHLGLRDAILAELPHTKHAFSMQHLMSKLSSWFSSSLDSNYEKFRTEFCRIRDLEAEEEFEHHWNQMVIEFKLAMDRHIITLFAHRSYWAVAYLRSWFFGDLLTMSHSIKVHSFFKGFVTSQTRLKDFVEQVGVAIDFQNQAGEEAARRIGQQTVQIKTCLPMEEHASTILSHYAFEMFQKEIMVSAQYAVFNTSGDTYLVRHYLKLDGGYKVICSPSNDEVSCSCKGFEHSGILCRHALRVLSLRNCFLVPEKYLLHRWHRESSLFPIGSGHSYRTQALRSLASIIIQESSITKDRFDYIQCHLSRILNHVRDMSPSDETTTGFELASQFDVTVDVVPSRSATRGRPRKIRGDNIVSEADAVNIGDNNA